MKKECYMITGNLSDFGSWKCGKGRAFNYLIKRGKKSIVSKKFNINRFWKFFLKNF